MSFPKKEKKRKEKNIISLLGKLLYLYMLMTESQEYAHLNGQYLVNGCVEQYRKHVTGIFTYQHGKFTR